MKNSPKNSEYKSKEYAIDHKKSCEEMQVQDESISEHPDTSPELKQYLQEFIETKNPKFLEWAYDKRFAQFFAKQFSPKEQALVDEYGSILKKIRKDDPKSKMKQTEEGQKRYEEASKKIRTPEEGVFRYFDQDTEILEKYILPDVAGTNENDLDLSIRMNLIETFKKKSQREKLEMAKVLLEPGKNNGAYLAKIIQYFGIESEKDRIKIAKMAVENAGSISNFTKYFKNFNIKSETARAEIAKYATSNGPQAFEHFENYEITSETLKKNIIENAIFNNSNAAASIESLNLTDDEFTHYLMKEESALGRCILYYYDIDQLTKKDLAEMFSLVLVANKGEALRYLEKYFPDHNTFRIEHYFEQLNVGSIKMGIQCAHANIPNFFPKCAAESVYADMQRMDAGLRLLAGFVSHTDNEFTSDAKQNSRQALSNISGFPVDEMENKEYSGDTMGDFYELILSIQKKTGTKKAFERFEFDDALFHKKKFSQILNLLYPLHNLLQLFNEGKNQYAMYDSLINTCCQWAEQPETPVIHETREQLQEYSKNIKEDLSKEKLKITPENIGIIASNLQESFNAWFSDIVKLDEDQKIQQEDLDKLIEKWGDIQPFAVLAARYHSEESEEDDWEEDELPILGKILRHTLKGTFHEYKYHGDAEDEYDVGDAKEQTKMFSEAQLEKWKENPSSLSLFSENSDAGFTNKELLERSYNIFERNVLHHLPAGLDKDKKYSLSVKDLLEKKGKALTKILKEQTSNQPKEILYHCLSILKTQTSINTLKNLISKLLSIGDIIGITGQLRDDLKSMSQVLTPQKSKGDTIIFSTIFDDPKLLLTIGDLVNTSSCQNYKTGEYIQTLPGYVIDANVKGIASFAVRPSRNLPKQDFDLVTEALRKNPNDVIYEFDAPKKILHISFKGKTYPVQFEYAYHRQVIKAGDTADEELGMLMEPPYVQTHPASSYMAQDVSNLFEGFAANIGAKTDVAIESPASRNTGGIYSDSAGGVQTEEYEIKPEKKDEGMDIENNFSFAA